MVTIISRKTWGALPANRTIYSIAASRRTGFVVHHSVSGTGSNAAGARALIRGFQRSHQGNGWGDIGYNFLIDAWGNIYEGRGLDKVGAHAGGHNSLNLGVCYIGDGRTGEMPDAAKQAFRNVYAWANRQAGKTLTRLVHSDLNATACPGPFIRNWVKAGGLTAGNISPAFAATPTTSPQSESEITMKLVQRTGEATTEWSLFHPSLNGETRIERGYMIVTDPQVALDLARTWHEGSGSESKEPRDVYIAMQRSARLTHDAYRRGIPQAAPTTVQAAAVAPQVYLGPTVSQIAAEVIRQQKLPGN